MEPIPNLEGIFFRSEDPISLDKIQNYLETVIDIPPFAIKLEVTTIDLGSEHASGARLARQYLSKGKGVTISDIYTWQHKGLVDWIGAPVTLTPSSSGNVNAPVGDLKATISLKKITGTSSYRLFPIIITNPESLEETVLENPVILEEDSLAIIPIPDPNNPTVYRRFLAVEMAL